MALSVIEIHKLGIWHAACFSQTSTLYYTTIADLDNNIPRLHSVEVGEDGSFSSHRKPRGAARAQLFPRWQSQKITNSMSFAVTTLKKRSSCIRLMRKPAVPAPGWATDVAWRIRPANFGYRRKNVASTGEHQHANVCALNGEWQQVISLAIPDNVNEMHVASDLLLLGSYTGHTVTGLTLSLEPLRLSAKPVFGPVEAYQGQFAVIGNNVFVKDKEAAKNRQAPLYAYSLSGGVKPTRTTIGKRDCGGLRIGLGESFAVTNGAVLRLIWNADIRLHKNFFLFITQGWRL